MPMLKRIPTSTVQSIPERRRSTRLFEKSIRIPMESTFKPFQIQEDDQIQTKIQKKKSNRRVSVIANYFETSRTTLSNTTVKSKTKQNLKSKHKEGILRLLNIGTIKELQVLPRIGLKTGYQIVTHRILNGPYKNFKQLEKLPFWRGDEFKRFMVANQLE